MKLQSSVLTVLAASSLALAACGSDDKKSKGSEESSTPAQAAAEIPAVKAGLDAALAQAKAGDRGRADRTVGDTYLEHFEKVEPALEKADPELMRSLETGMATDLRRQIKDGAPQAALQVQVNRLGAQLDQARAKLG
jgi:hypothetical protein